MLCFRKLPVSKEIMHNKGGGGIKNFRRNFFCLEVLKEFVGEHFCDVFQKNSGSEKLYGYKRGGQDFPSKNFYPTRPKTLAKESFCVVFQKTSGIEKEYA